MGGRLLYGAAPLKQLEDLRDALDVIHGAPHR